MADAGHGGSIICTASGGRHPLGRGGPAYSASKAGVINLAMVSAQQLCETGVRVNAICPGLTETGMTAPTFNYAKDKGVTHKLGRLNPLRRAAQPEELANVALFLASRPEQLCQRPGHRGGWRAVQLAPRDPAIAGADGCLMTDHHILETRPCTNPST
jgi:NAD(P)-dependent dehydrogenase (short-subunit alcohol dehydrogenase family)